MAVKTVKISKLGKKYKISPNFTLGEMACKDGSDTVLYSEELFAKLEQLRAYVGGTIGINSGYRTKAYNKKIGGASSSNHVKGRAADIVVKKDGKRVPGKIICCICQDLGFKGIALIKGTGYSVHVDMRASGTYRGDERYGYSNNVGGDFYKYFKLSKSDVEKYKAKPAAPAPTPAPAKPQEEEEMTKEEFKKMFDECIADLAKQPATWEKADVEWAKKQGIISGDDQGNAMPKKYLTRGEMAAILKRILADKWA